MIVREKPTAWELLFILKGSVIPKIWRQLLLVFSLSLIVMLMEWAGIYRAHPAPQLFFSLIAIALSIFAGFRNSASYERWWEARRLWGQLAIEARSLSRQARAHMSEAGASRVTNLIIAFIVALRNQLRDEPTDMQQAPFAGLPANIGRAPVELLPVRILDLMSMAIATEAVTHDMRPETTQLLEERVFGLTAAQSGSERIKTTPLPYGYSLLLHRTAYAFCLLLPFGLADAKDLWTPLLSVIVAYTFFGLDALGDELAQPFGKGENALPLNAITRTIEISLLDQSGRRDLPEPVFPNGHILS